MSDAYRYYSPTPLLLLPSIEVNAVSLDTKDFLKYMLPLSRNMLNHKPVRKLWVVMPMALVVFAVLLGTHAQSVNADIHVGKQFIPHPLDVPIATSGNNVYMAWPNNDTGHFNVFFAKSTDGGKTLKTMMISAPNKAHTVDLNTQISASGNNVYVTWWTNKTGTLMPVFRASNDNGDTFAKAITLNSTG